MKNLVLALKCYLLITLLTGVIYPLLVTAFGALLFPWRAHGSFTSNAKGEIVGSLLLAQNFRKPEYFWPRPSAIDFNPMPSGGSNFSATSAELVKKVQERRMAGAVEDMLYASASGLDPHISPLAAARQIERVAQARGVPEEKVRAIVAANTESRQLGILGEPRVNVLKLNLELDRVR